MTINPSTPSSRHTLANTLILLTILSAVCITFFSVGRPGNVLGNEDWLHPYLVERGSTMMVQRPLALILLWLAEPLLGANPAAMYAASITVWIVIAFMVYLNVRQLAPNRPLFAAACAIVFLIYIPEDFWYFQNFNQTADHQAALLMMLVALYCHFRYMAEPHGTRWLAASLISVLIAPMIREAVLPMLLGMPVLVFAIQRRFTRARWLGMGLWVTAILITAAYYAIGLSSGGQMAYGQSLFKGLDVGRILMATRQQIEYAVNPVLHPGFARIRAVWPQVVTLVVLVSGGVYLLSRRFSEPEHPERLAALKHHAVWIFGGLCASLLGVAAYLPTIYAIRIERTQWLSRPGEAVVLVSLIWLAADLLPRRIAAMRWLVRAGGIAFVGMTGLAMAGYIQLRLDTYGGTWENFSKFMRSLSEQVPNVEDPTLLIYMENPHPYEAPFTAGYGFQFAMRYFYEDRATGIMPNEILYGYYELRDEGIYMAEDQVSFPPRLYGWDEVIVIARDENDEVIILDRLPDQLYTAERQRLYDPYSRILNTDRPAHIEQTFYR